MLDTKLKNNKNNKYIVRIIAITTILIASVGMVLTYPKIKNESKQFRNNVFEYNGDFSDNIRESTYGLYYKIKSENMSEPIRPVDLMLEVDKSKQYQERDNYSNNENITSPTDIDPYTEEVMESNDRFDDIVTEYYDYLVNNLKNLEYYVLDKENSTVIKNTNLDIDGIMANEQKSVDKMKDKYRLYVALDFDDKGNLTIEQVHGADKDNIKSIVDTNNGYALDINELVSGFKLKPIKNMKYVYAVPENLAYTDSISYYVNSEIINSYQRASYLYINIAMIFVVLIVLLIPYKEIQYLLGFKKIVKIPIEIIVTLAIIAFMFIYGSGEVIIAPSINTELINFTQLKLSKEAIDIITYLINIIYWIICFTSIFIGCVIIKYILKLGIINYINEHSLTVNILKYIVRKTKLLYRWCTSVELSKDNNKKIMTILAINMIVVMLMCSIWFFGLIIVPIYTVIITVLIKKNYLKVLNDYNKLLDITKQIANGNLETNIDDDVGVFNALKDELANIQSGFKRAVDEEVKSQKMKTELISNVSHDLKTPLTSIITYVDLLKDESLDEEKRILYIDTLDRKSERLKVLIEDLFEVSKANSGNVSLNIMEIDVVSLMKQTLLEVDDKFKDMSLVVRKNLPDEKIMLKLDSQRTFRIFENLLVNITKYAMPGSRVYIDILDKEGIVEVSLKNMTADEISFNVDELVERFVRGDKSRNTEGSGLGLAIAKSFVELQGGEFEVSVDGDLFKVVIKFKK